MSDPTLPNTQTNRIKKLPPLLINQLAAGEVVTRPASVVKELIENAIDATATHIEVRITQGGMGMIEVRDDGCGIEADDMVMAVTRYATSKVADVANLQGICTLGFRGEALAATAAVSRLTLISSTDDSGIGRQLELAGILTENPTLTPVVHPKGTLVRVQDLYFNVPARRGNLKSIATEFAHIEAVVKQLALVASHVTFELWHDGKRRFMMEGVTNQRYQPEHSQINVTHSSYRHAKLLSRMAVLLPQPFMPDSSEASWLELSVDLTGLTEQNNQTEQIASASVTAEVWGILIPLSDLSGQNNRQDSKNLPKLIYVNGRLVQDRRIANCLRHCVNEPLSDMGYVLMFNLPSSWLNVNVHPSKQSIKIANLMNILAHVQLAVQAKLDTWQAQLKPLSQSSPKTNPSFPQTSLANDTTVRNGNQQLECKTHSSFNYSTKPNAPSQLATFDKTSRTTNRTKVAMPKQVYQIDNQINETAEGAQEDNYFNVDETVTDSSYPVLYEQVFDHETLCLIQTSDGLAVMSKEKLAKRLDDSSHFAGVLISQLSYAELMTLMLNTAKVLS